MSVTRVTRVSEFCASDDVVAGVPLSTGFGLDACDGVSAGFGLATDSRPGVEDDVVAGVPLSTGLGLDVCEGVSAGSDLATDSRPEVEVRNDFDDYFRRYVARLVEQKVNLGQPFRVKKIVIDAGPWRSCDVRFERTADTLFLDFYSACRWLGGPDALSELLNLF